MNPRGRYFPGQEKEEKVFLLIRKHWFNYLIFFFIGVLAILPIAAGLIYVNVAAIVMDPATSIIWVILGSVYLLIIIGLELYAFIGYYLDVYIVTDRRIVDIVQNGFFKRDISELHLQQVQDVSAHVEGFFQTMLQFGDIYIQTAGERENFVFQSIPKPYVVAKQIIDLHERELERVKRRPKPYSDKYIDKELERGLPGREMVEKSPIYGKNNQTETRQNESDMAKQSDINYETEIPVQETDNSELKEGQEINLK